MDPILGDSVLDFNSQLYEPISKVLVLTRRHEGILLSPREESGRKRGGDQIIGRKIHPLRVGRRVRWDSDKGMKVVEVVSKSQESTRWRHSWRLTEVIVYEPTAKKEGLQIRMLTL